MRYATPPLVLLLALASPGAAAAQATVEDLDPADAVVRVTRFAAATVDTAVTGMDLEPGDLVEASADGVLLWLRCATEGDPTDFRLSGQFGAMLNATQGTTCRLTMLRGALDVLTDEPTEVTAGGVTLGSSGTQYAVRLGRSDGRPWQRVNVYDGTVEAGVYGSIMAVRPGLSYGYNPTMIAGETFSTLEADLDRSADIYARSDLSRAVQAGTPIDDEPEARRQLKALYAEVLRDPDSEAKRVDLAKAQIRYKLDAQAVYHLKRARVDDESTLRRYEIDPGILRATTTTGRLRLAPTTDDYLGMIERGDVDAAIEGLKRRIEQGQTTSRDYYAMARAYEKKNDPRQSADYARRALTLHRRDDALSEREVAELNRLLRR